MTNLLDLARRCEEATGPDRDLNAEIIEATGGLSHRVTVPDYVGSLDAAMRLVPEGTYGGVMFGVDDDGKAKSAAFVGIDLKAMNAPETEAATPALALCAAAIRARSTMTGEGG